MERRNIFKMCFITISNNLISELFFMKQKIKITTNVSLLKRKKNAFNHATEHQPTLLETKEAASEHNRNIHRGEAWN